MSGDSGSSSSLLERAKNLMHKVETSVNRLAMQVQRDVSQGKNNPDAELQSAITEGTKASHIGQSLSRRLSTTAPADQSQNALAQAHAAHHASDAPVLPATTTAASAPPADDDDELAARAQAHADAQASSSSGAVAQTEQALEGVAHATDRSIKAVPEVRGIEGAVLDIGTSVNQSLR